VKHLENELAKPIKASADRPGIAEQVRTHFKTMALDQRLPALRALIANGDTESASAILGAPAFLSGFETFKPEVMGPVVKELNAKMQPTVAKRLDAVRAASDFLGKRSYLNTECVRVIGVSPNRLSKLRAGKSESERARALLDSRIGIAGI
jgi:DNA-binding Xre family transcriptional regulator